MKANARPVSVDNRAPGLFLITNTIKMAIMPRTRREIISTFENYPCGTTVPGIFTIKW
jgi:hypothetical protein